MRSAIDRLPEAPSGFLAHGERGPVLGSTATAIRETVHATCLVVGEAGVLIRGEPGAGKSALALALIDRVGLRGDFAALVADDRVRLAVVDGRLAARPHPDIAGLIEIRGYGIVAIASVEACTLRLVVDLVADGTPPVEPPADATLLGIALPRLLIGRTAWDAGLGPQRVLDALGVSSQPHTPDPVRRILPPP